MTSPLISRSDSKLTYSSIAVLILLAMILGVKFRDWNFDDGAIVYRLVRNILEHHEWGYNLGESFNPSTSVLNTVAIAILGVLGLPIPLAAHIVGTIGLALLGVFIFLALSPVLMRVPSFLIAAGAIIATGYSSAWGLETHLFLGILAFVSYRQANANPSWIGLGFLVLTRPDGIIVVALTAATQFLKLRALPIKGLSFVFLILLPWLVFSLFYFGQLFPDTLGVKMWQGRSGLWGSGHIYAKGLLEHCKGALSAAALFLVLVSLFAGRPILRALGIFLLFIAIQQLAYVFLNVPAYHWYFIPFDLGRWILAASLVAYFAKPYFTKLKFEFQVCGFAACAVGLLVLTLSDASKETRRDTRDSAYQIAASKINELRPEAKIIAALEVGSLGYALKQPIVDLVGLASRNPEFVSGSHTDEFFAKKVDVVVLHEPLWHFERAIFDDVRFELLYHRIGKTEQPPFSMSIYELDAEHARIDLKEFVRNSYPGFLGVNHEAFSAASIVADSSALCTLDRVNGIQVSPGDVVVSKPLLFAISGWAALKDNFNPVGKLRVSLLSSDSTRLYQIEVPERVSRPDVATQINRPDEEFSGFVLRASLTELPLDDYRVFVGQSISESEVKWCGPFVMLRIAP